MADPRSPLDNAPMRPWLTVPSDWRRANSAASYDLYWDDAREFGALWPRPSPETIPTFYDIPYYTHADQNNEKDSSWTPAQRLAMAVAWRFEAGGDLDHRWMQRFVAPAPATLCDLGCGDGALLADLKGAGYDVTGVEPDPLARRAASARTLKVLDGTAEHLPAALEERSFDIVVLSHVLEHCLHPVTALQNARSLLRNGGTAVIETPNNACAGLRQAGIYWPWLDVPRHLNFFTTRSLRWACEQAGLQVEAVQYRGYARHFDPDWLRQEEEIRRALDAHRQKISDLALLARLVATLPLSPSRKCDSVRVLCRAG